AGGDVEAVARERGRVVRPRVGDARREHAESACGSGGMAAVAVAVEGVGIRMRGQLRRAFGRRCVVIVADEVRAALHLRSIRSEGQVVAELMPPWQKPCANMEFGETADPPGVLLCDSAATFGRRPSQGLNDLTTSPSASSDADRR